MNRRFYRKNAGKLSYIRRRTDGFMLLMGITIAILESIFIIALIKHMGW